MTSVSCNKIKMRNIFLITLLVLLIVVGCNPGPKEKPSVGAVAGTYRLTVKSIKFLIDHKAYKSIPNSEISLQKDGIASITGLPDCYVNGVGNGSGQFLSGQGRWEIEATDLGYGVTLTIIEGGTLKHGIYHGSSILVKGRTPPFRLRFGIGEDEYIVYEKTTS